MAKIKNTVDINVTEKGSKKAAGNINEVTKAQTRQTSAGVSASKQFAAQSQGLGGFVAAYAGAAANVFALQQAFSALQRAVQFETVIQGTKALASEIGISGEAVLKSVKGITNGQIAIEEAAQNVNIALSAGFNTEQIESLTEIATKASRVLGRNLTDSLQRVVRGTAKLEPELLDEIGIFARIDPAVEAYASKLNVSASSLTNFEKRQAFANAVIEEGQKKFAAIDTSIGGNQATLEKFIVQLQELAIGFGQIVANVLSPFIEFFSENNRALLAFLGILTLVFGKAASLVGASITKMVGKITNFTDKLADMGKKSKDVGKELAGSFDVAKGAEGSVGEGKGFNPRIAGQDAKQQAKLQETLNRQKQNNLKTTSQLTKANAVYSKSLDALNKNADGNAKRIAFLNSLLAQNKAALDKASFSAKAFAATSIFAGKAINFLAIQFGRLQMFLGIIFAITAALQLFGVDILGKVGDMFKDFSQRAEDANVTLNALIATAEGSSAAFQKMAEKQGVSKKELEGLKEIQEEVASRINNADAFANPFISSVPKIRKFRDQLISTGVAGQKVANQIVSLTLALKDADTALEKLVIEAAIKSLEKLGDTSLILAHAAREAGLSGDQVGQAFAYLTDKGVEADVILKEFGEDLENLSDNGKSAAGDLAAIGNVLNLANKAFLEGRTNTEKLSQQLFGSKERFKSLTDGLTDFSEASEKTIDQVNLLAKDIGVLQDRVNDLRFLDVVGKGLDNTFGKFIKSADEAAFKGLFGAEKTAESQAALLKSIIETGDAAAATTKTDKRTLRQIELGNKARKVAVGLALELPKIIDEQLRKQEQLNQTLQIQLETTRKQNVLKEEQQNLASLRVSQNIENKQATELNKKLEVQKKLQEQILNSIKAKAQFEREMISLQGRENEIARNLAEINRKAAADAKIGALQSDLRGIQSDRAEQEAFSGLFTRSQVDEKRLELINKEFELQIAVIDEKERVAKEEAENARIALRERILLLAKEREEQQKVLDKTIAIQEIEKQLEANKQKAETDKIKQENERLKQQKIVVEAQRQAQLSALRGRVLAQKFADQAELRELEALEANVELVNAFSDAVGVTPFVKAIDEFVKESQRKRGVDDTGIGTLTKFEPDKIKFSAGELRKQIEGNQAMRAQQFSAQAAAISGIAGAKTGDLNAQIAANQGLLKDTQERQDLESRLSEMKRQDAITELENQIKISDKKIENAFKEFDLIDSEEIASLDALERQRQAAQDLRDEKIKEIKRERDAFRNFGSEVSKVFSGELTNSFKSFYQSIAEGNSILDSAKGAFNSFMLNILEGLQEKLTDKFITPVLEDIGAGIFGSIFGAASAAGGPVQLAAGGSMKRDRVPAMLEPGEFVIRKPMARAIGGPALSAMNGHGTGLGMPNIEVQLNNSGQPKDAEAQVKPNMDVNKMVVEIVTRDLRNNGPIRKTLRGDS